MKTLVRFLILAAALVGAALAQTGSGTSNYLVGVQYVLVAPSGACVSTAFLQYVMGTSGTLYGCKAGTWQVLATGGSGVSFSAITSGNNTTASMRQSGTAVLGFASGASNAPSVFFTADGPGTAGIYRAGGAFDAINWTDNTGLGGDLWGFNGQNQGGIYVIDSFGFFGFGPGDGTCTTCLRQNAPGQWKVGGAFNTDGIFNGFDTAAMITGLGTPFRVAGGFNSSGYGWASESTVTGTDTIVAAMCYGGASGGTVTLDDRGCGSGTGGQGHLQLKGIEYSDGCVSAAGTCAAHSTGFVTIAAAATTRTVSTTAVRINATCNSTNSQTCSHIHIQEDATKGAALGVTCNTTVVRTYAVTTTTDLTSFVITASAAPAVNPACLSFTID